MNTKNKVMFGYLVLFQSGLKTIINNKSSRNVLALCSRILHSSSTSTFKFMSLEKDRFHGYKDAHI